jgi:hypothetical protein
MTERETLMKKLVMYQLVDINALSITTSLCKASGIRTFLSLYFQLLWVMSHVVKQLFQVSSSCAHWIYTTKIFIFCRTLLEKLKHLRYLDLSYNSELKKLPNSITELQNLQTLILFSCTSLKSCRKTCKN